MTTSQLLQKFDELALDVYFSLLEFRRAALASNDVCAALDYDDEPDNYRLPKLLLRVALAELSRQYQGADSRVKEERKSERNVAALTYPDKSAKPSPADIERTACKLVGMLLERSAR
jgi:hypothetical protein